MAGETVSISEGNSDISDFGVFTEEDLVDTLPYPDLYLLLQG